MMRYELAFGAGVVIGVAAVGTIVYYLHKNKKANEEMESEVEEKFARKLKENSINIKMVDELLKKQTYVDVLSSRELTAWFKENRGEFPDTIKMLICVPTEENIKGLGYNMVEEIDPNKSILQVFYNSDTGKVLKTRIVSFGDIDSNLQARLIEEDGIIVVKN